MAYRIGLKERLALVCQRAHSHPPSYRTIRRPAFSNLDPGLALGGSLHRNGFRPRLKASFDLGRLSNSGLANRLFCFQNPRHVR